MKPTTPTPSLQPHPHGPRRVWAGLVLALCMAGAQADSAISTASTASTAAGSASTSLSQSSAGSSNSSTPATQAARGPFEVLALTPVEGQPDLVQLTLRQRPDADAQATPGATASVLELQLRLPRAVAQREALQPGQTLLAQARPYGVAFSLQAPQDPGRETVREPFFLVLDDHWHHGLQPHRVGG